MAKERFFIYFKKNGDWNLYHPDSVEDLESAQKLCAGAGVLYETRRTAIISFRSGLKPPEQVQNLDELKGKRIILRRKKKSEESSQIARP